MKAPQKLKYPNKYSFLTIMTQKVFQNDNYFVLVINYYFGRFTGSHCNPSTAVLLSQRHLLEHCINSLKTDTLLKNRVLAKLNNCGVAVNAAVVVCYCFQITHDAVLTQTQHM